MRTRLRIAPPSTALPPLAERGRMLFTRDVQELYGKTPDGKFRKGEWWVRNKFAPHAKRKAGRDPFWWECEAVRWMDEQTANEDAA